MGFDNSRHLQEAGRKGAEVRAQSMERANQERLVFINKEIAHWEAKDPDSFSEEQLKYLENLKLRGRNIKKQKIKYLP